MLRDRRGKEKAGERERGREKEGEREKKRKGERGNGIDLQKKRLYLPYFILS